MIRTVKKHEERWNEIVSCARELFLEKEYEKTSMRDIINTLGIAKGTIYHYFNSKEELLDAVIEIIVDEYFERLKSLLKGAKGNALDRLQFLITESNVSKEQKNTIEQLHRPGNIGLHARLIAHMMDRLAPLYADVIKQGCDEGLFKCDYPLETSEFLLGGIQLMTDVGFYPWDNDEIKRRTKAIPFLIEAQLSAKKGSVDFLTK